MKTDRICGNLKHLVEKEERLNTTTKDSVSNNVLEPKKRNTKGTKDKDYINKTKTEALVTTAKQHKSSSQRPLEACKGCITPTIIESIKNVYNRCKLKVRP